MQSLQMRHLVGLVVTAAFFCIFAAVPTAAQGLPCTQCGPDAHWIDQCSAGTDEIANQRATVGIDTDGDCASDHDLILDACLGPDNILTIKRSAPLDDSQNFPGLRPPDGHLDVIDTEILSLCLTKDDIVLIAGAGRGQNNDLAPSLGAIAEKVGDPEVGVSFFHVFFEVYRPPPYDVYLYNQTPLLLQTDIDCVPPKAKYIHIGGCIPLHTSPTPGQGMHVANLTSANHDVNPSEIIPTLTEWGMIIFCVLVLGFMTWGIVRRKRTVEVGI